MKDARTCRVTCEACAGTGSRNLTPGEMGSTPSPAAARSGTPALGACRGTAVCR